MSYLVPDPQSSEKHTPPKARDVWPPKTRERASQQGDKTATHPPTHPNPKKCLTIGARKGKKRRMGTSSPSPETNPPPTLLATVCVPSPLPQMPQKEIHRETVSGFPAPITKPGETLLFSPYYAKCIFPLPSPRFSF